jgi:myotubularin-related protein 14
MLERMETSMDGMTNLNLVLLTYTAVSKLGMITHMINLLFGVDYDCEFLDNEDGQVCATYPLKLVFLKGEKAGNSTSQAPSILRDPLQLGARFGRVRTRFPMPVMLFRGKNICRSSSLTMRLEALVQTTHNTIRDTLGYSDGSGAQTSPEQASNDSAPSDSAEMQELLQLLQNETSTAMDKHRLADITLIRTLRVSHIADLMMENCKRIMGVSVCSSEKNDSYKRYADFTLLVLPYPGVEFFKHFNPQHPELAPSLHFDWTSWPPVNRPPGSVSFEHDLISQWDAVSITSNYLKTILYTLCDSECKGLLVHCISGWDRTPLFVSLIRLSLWADEEMHTSLNAEQILYLTIAYDWMMFRHQLVLRQSHSEDIFGFCFYFLEYITGHEFCTETILKRIGSGSSTTSMPSPAPLYKPSILSYVSDGDSNSNTSIAQPSQAMSSIKAKQTPIKVSNKTATAVDSPSSTQKSFLDGIIISSYKGKSQMELAMEPMKPLEDILYRRAADSSEEDDYSAASSAGSDSSSGANYSSPSFQPISFGFDAPAPSAPPPSQIDDVVPHPLESNPMVQDELPPPPALSAKAAIRKQRLDQVRALFIQHYHSSMVPYFQDRRKQSFSSLWSWLPSFGLGGTSTGDVAKRN